MIQPIDASYILSEISIGSPIPILSLGFSRRENALTKRVEHEENDSIPDPYLLPASMEPRKEEAPIKEDPEKAAGKIFVY